MAQRSKPDIVLVIFGLLAWVVAVLFGVFPTTFDTNIAVDRGTGYVRAVSPSGAAAAAGFAVAGGLCFVGAALASRPTGSRPATKPPGAPEARGDE